MLRMSSSLRRIADTATGTIAAKVLKQRPATVQRGAEVCLALVELEQAGDVVVRAIMLSPDPTLRLGTLSTLSP